MHPFQTMSSAFGIALVVTILSIPLVTRLALHFHFVDRPNARKVHKKQMPRLGGVSIALGFAAGLLYLLPNDPDLPAFLAGAVLILTTGIIDDRFQLPARLKLAMQIIASVVFVSLGPVIEFVNIPFIGYYQFGWLSYPITIFWIITITNAINLIDGLDGLASGVSSIALSFLLIMAILQHQFFVMGLTVILLGGTIGFLLFNFHPAKIFMGDSGSMFIGYTIAVISVTGLFKSLTLFSLIIPIIILAVPIFDTVFAVIRRLMKRQSLSTPDKLHLHHRLMALGFSHRMTVLIIYTISFFFSVAAVILSKSFLWGSLLVVSLCLAMLQLLYELADVLNRRKKPIVDSVRKLVTIGSASKANKR